MLRDSLVSNDGKVLGSDEGIKMGSNDNKALGPILGNVDVITLGIDVVTELGSLDESFDGSNDVKLEVLLLGGLLGFTDGKVLGSDEGIKTGSTDVNMLGTIIVNVDGITLSIDVGT